MKCSDIDINQINVLSEWCKDWFVRPPVRPIICLFIIDQRTNTLKSHYPVLCSFPLKEQPVDSFSQVKENNGNITIKRKYISTNTPLTACLVLYMDKVSIVSPFFVYCTLTKNFKLQLQYFLSFKRILKQEHFIPPMSVETLIKWKRDYLKIRLKIQQYSFM